MLQTKFNRGDTVYYGTVNSIGHAIICPDCLGTKEWLVKTPAGQEFKTPCGTCTQGWETLGTINNWECIPHVEKLTIGSVRIDTADRENPIAYMCTETGVGSGTVYNEKDLFLSELEALAYATTKASSQQNNSDERNLEQIRKNRKSYYKPKLSDEEGRKLLGIIRRLENEIKEKK